MCLILDVRGSSQRLSSALAVVKSGNQKGIENLIVIFWECIYFFFSNFIQNRCMNKMSYSHQTIMLWNIAAKDMWLCLARIIKLRHCFLNAWPILWLRRQVLEYDCLFSLWCCHGNTQIDIWTNIRAIVIHISWLTDHFLWHIIDSYFQSNSEVTT